MLKGIDVSDNNGKINWQAVKQSGIDFAIIRLGYGNDDTTQDDGRFEENVAECERLGIPWGAYIYSYALNEAEALSEVNHCIRRLSGKRPSFPVCFDMEDADGYKKNRGGLSSEQTVKICETFLLTLESRGYYVALYASLSWLTGILNDRRLDRFDKWVAQWNTVCEYGGSYGLWQYGGSTNYLESPYLSGISGAVDKNYALYDYPQIIKSRGLNGFEKPTEPESEYAPTEPEVIPPEIKTDEEEKPEPQTKPTEETSEKSEDENAEKDEEQKVEDDGKSGGFLHLIFAALKQLLRLIAEWIRS